MVEYAAANLFTFTDESGSIQLTYYPHAPGPLIQGQPSGGPRLAYQGPEGSFVFPDAGPGREHINVQQESPLGPLVSVVLVPTIDATAVTLTLLLPPINLAGQDGQDFETVAIRDHELWHATPRGSATHLRGDRLARHCSARVACTDSASGGREQYGSPPVREEWAWQ